MKNKTEKIHYNDVKVIKGKDAKDYYKVEGGNWSLNEHYVRFDACTHMNCKECGVEMEKHYSGICTSCKYKEVKEKYEKLELVEWDGKTPLCEYDGDQYFFDEYDIESYCEDNEIDKSQLMLVVCDPTHFQPVNLCESQGDVTHEDWEADAELIELQKKVDEYFTNASTNTWVPGKKRVTL